MSQSSKYTRIETGLFERVRRLLPYLRVSTGEDWSPRRFIEDAVDRRLRNLERKRKTTTPRKDV